MVLTCRTGFSHVARNVLVFATRGGMSGWGVKADPCLPHFSIRHGRRTSLEETTNFGTGCGTVSSPIECGVSGDAGCCSASLFVVIR